jgi:hypothetical protein
MNTNGFLLPDYQWLSFEKYNSVNEDRPFEYYYLRFIKIIYREKVDVGGREREHPFPPVL